MEVGAPPALEGLTRKQAVRGQLQPAPCRAPLARWRVSTEARHSTHPACPHPRWRCLCALMSPSLATQLTPSPCGAPPRARAQLLVVEVQSADPDVIILLGKCGPGSVVIARKSLLKELQKVRGGVNPA